MAVHRRHLPEEERSARSKLAHLVHNRRLLRGSLVSMSRKCGKSECKCVWGEKHVSLYLAVRVGKKRKMVYVPSSWESTVRSWVEAYQEVDHLMERISQSCLERFLKGKQESQKKE